MRSNTMEVAGLAVLVAMAVMLSGCQNPFQALVSKHVSPKAIDGFVTITDDMDKKVHEYCGKKNVDMANITESIWWPGCGMISKMSEFAAKGSGDGKCPASGCVNKATMEDMDAFNKKHGGKRVSYNSRAGKDKDGKEIEVVKLTGWWLPAPNAKADTPRIVLQHGFTSNSNKFRTMFVAYLLRKHGYSVLVNNLRDHCYSEDSSQRVIGWGHAYPFDLLGAWDYLKDKASEPIDASKVGILGFSMGGFTANNAFGLEPKIPAVWIDGAPITPRAGFEVGFKQALGKADFVHGHIINDVWKDIEAAAAKKGVDLNEHLPEKELPNGPDTKRKVFVTANKKDDTVPYSSGEALAALLRKHPKKYDLVEFWTLDGDCQKVTHCVDFLRHTDQYSEKLGKFWASVFDSDSHTQRPGSHSHTERLYDAKASFIQDASSSSSILVGASVFAVAVGLVVMSRRVRASSSQLELLSAQEELEEQTLDAEE